MDSCDVCEKPACAEYVDGDDPLDPHLDFRRIGDDTSDTIKLCRDHAWFFCNESVAHVKHVIEIGSRSMARFCETCKVETWPVEEVDICPKCNRIWGWCPRCEFDNTEFLAWTAADEKYERDLYQNQERCTEEEKEKWLKQDILLQNLDGKDLFFRPPYSKDQPLETWGISNTTLWLFRCLDCNVYFTGHND